jgi:two-component system, chemotaxis family, CheB/CheR fusion protein
MMVFEPLRTPTGSARMGFTPELVDELDMVRDWGLLTTDADLTITGWNHWLERHSGKQAEAFVGKPLFDVFPELVSRKLDAGYRQALAGQTVIFAQRLHQYFLPLPSSAKNLPRMQQTARIIPLVRGATICGTVTLIEDVTERVVYEMDLRERVEALRQADRRKDEFLAMLAHELRNPLAPLSNAVELLRLVGNGQPTFVSIGDMVGRQVHQLVRLVDDLLDVSRITRGKIELQRARLDLAAVIHQAVETSRPVIDAHRHHLEVALPLNPVWTEVDFVRMTQVVSNLLNNAAKYTDEGGRIWLTVEEVASSSSPEAVIRVRDNGRGIDEAALVHLFDLFYQVDRTIDRSDGGLGIGLALVKNLVEMHGGKVSAYSAGRGKGSEFTVRIPLAKQAKPQTPSTDPASAPTVRPARILVVDDNRDSADSLQMLLEMDGHEVWTAHDGNRAVSLALQHRPAVILLDIGLPGLNGLEVCKILRERGLTDALVVAMTGYGQCEDREVSSAAGFDAHQVKPLDLAVLKRLLTNRQAGVISDSPR